MGPAGLSSVALSVAHKLHKAQTGSLYHYTLLILATIASILTMRQIWLIFAYDFDYRALVLIFITFFFILSSEK
jgi:hypothetical protein